MNAEDMFRLAQELVIVAEGGQPHRMRMLVQEMMPDNKKDAERYMTFVRRMKMAAEAMESSATESYVVVMRGDK